MVGAPPPPPPPPPNTPRPRPPHACTHAQTPEHLDRELGALVAHQWVALDRPDKPGAPYFYNQARDRGHTRDL